MRVAQSPDTSSLFGVDGSNISVQLEGSLDIPSSDSLDSSPPQLIGILFPSIIDERDNSIQLEGSLSTSSGDVDVPQLMGVLSSSTIDGRETSIQLEGSLSASSSGAAGASSSQLVGALNQSVILSDKTFVYTQAVSSAEWRVFHRLGKFPSVSVVDSAGNMVIGNVLYVDANNVIITFMAPFQGSAYLN